jgi:hypothetical protein
MQPHAQPVGAQVDPPVRRRATSALDSHVVALLYAQFTHLMNLNDVRDALRHYGGKLLRIRRATAPSKNALSYAKSWARWSDG